MSNSITNAGAPLAVIRFISEGAVKRLRSRYALVLTGTPLENKLEELYSIVQFVDDRRLGPAFQFLAQLQIVVQLAVKNDSYVSPFVPNGLLAARKVDDAQTPQCKRQPWGARIIDQKSVALRPAMPVRRKIARSSASDSAAAPCLSNRSRGRSCSGHSAIRMVTPPIP